MSDFKNYQHYIVVQSRNPDRKEPPFTGWNDIKSFPVDDDFELISHDKDEVDQIKREFKQDLPKFQTRTIKRSVEL